jgi:hypothetical protein
LGSFSQIFIMLLKGPCKTEFHTNEPKISMELTMLIVR